MTWPISTPEVDVCSAWSHRWPPRSKRGDSLVEAAARPGLGGRHPAEIVAALRPLADAGVECAMLGHYDHADEAALELIASDVMPALQ